MTEQLSGFAWNLPNIHAAGRQFEKYLKVPFKEFYDAETSYLFKKVQMDILKFDEWCTGQGMLENESLQDFVLRTYGEEARDLLLRLI